MNKDKLHQWFSEHNIKSISPPMALLLFDIAEKIWPEIVTEKDYELHRDLGDYRDALLTVCSVAAVHQKAVIDKLGAFVRDGSSD